MNGFRKGKVPRTVLEQRYGRHVRDEVQKELVQESFVAAAHEHKLEPVTEPVVEEAVLTPGEGFRFSARIEIRAPVDLKEMDGLPANRKKVDIGEPEVDRAMENRRRQHTEYKPIAERKTSATSDVLIVAIVAPSRATSRSSTRSIAPTCRSTPRRHRQRAAPRHGRRAHRASRSTREGSPRRARPPAGTRRSRRRRRPATARP